MWPSLARSGCATVKLSASLGASCCRSDKAQLAMGLQTLGTGGTEVAVVGAAVLVRSTVPHGEGEPMRKPAPGNSGYANAISAASAVPFLTPGYSSHFIAMLSSWTTCAASMVIPPSICMESVVCASLSKVRS